MSSVATDGESLYSNLISKKSVKLLHVQHKEAAEQSSNFIQVMNINTLSLLTHF